MAFFGRPSRLVAGLACGGIALIGESMTLFFLRSRTLHTENELVRRRKELRTLVKTVPVPSAENAARIETDVARVFRAVALWREKLCPSSETVERWTKEPVPASRTDAFFDLATFVEAMRSRAKEQGVAINADERFGFSAYAHEGPEVGSIAEVIRWRRVAEYLAVALWNARPRQLLAFQREKPGVAGAARKATRDPESSSRDFFDEATGVSLRWPGEIETRAFRVVFVGRTNELRSFITEITRGDVPLAIRSVEVEPAAVEMDTRAEARRLERGSEMRLPTSADEKPVVVSVPMKFTVTVEFLALGTQRAAASVSVPGASS